MAKARGFHGMRKVRTRFIDAGGIRLSYEKRKFLRDFFGERNIEIEFLHGIDAFTAKKPDTGR